ncbi:helix-turn-helix domain-containing protein [Paenibacillus paeoniae]|nr:helix-turn-helix domain-containing protein [Paenibacillus paeoniae]
MAMSLFFDNEVIPLLYGKSFDYADISFKLWKLDKIVDSSTYLHSITVYNAYTDKYISTYRPFQDNLNGEIASYEHQLAAYPEWPKLTMIPIQEKSGSGQMDGEEVPISYFSYVLYDQQGDTPGGKSKLILNVQASWLFNNIQNVNDLAYKQSNTLLLLADEGQLYAADRHAGETIPDALIARLQTSNTEFDSFTFGRGSDKSIVTLMPLGVQNWKIVNIQSYALALEPLANIQKTMLVSMLFFLLLSLALIFPISQRLYRPVERMVHQVKGSPSTEMAQGAADHDEWSYLSGVYTNLVQRVEQVKQHYSKNKSMIEHFHIHNLLTDSTHLTREGFEQWVTDRHAHMKPEGPFCVCALQIDGYKQRKVQMKGKENDLYVFAIGNITEELLAASCDCIWTYMGEGLFIFLVVPDDNGPGRELYGDAFSEAQRVIQSYYGLSVTLSLSTSVPSFVQITEAYLEARELIQYRMLYGYRAFITSERVAQHRNKRALESIPAQEKRIIEELKRGNSKQLTGQIELFFELSMQLSYAEFIQAVLHLTMATVGAIQDMNDVRLHPVRVELVHLHKEVMDKETIGEIKAIFLDLAARRVHDTESLTHKKTEMICGTIKDIIAENCADTEFYQQSAADMLKMSSAYLGRLFKQGTGQSFTEYLNDIRLSKALELLDSDHISINEVMEQCGYRSQSHFFKLFKIKYGTTPGEYRLKQIMKKQEKVQAEHS